VENNANKAAGKADEKMSFHPALPNPLSAVMSGHFPYLPGNVQCEATKKKHLMQIALFGF